jgi:hypothetical protein
VIDPLLFFDPPNRRLAARYGVRRTTIRHWAQNGPLERSSCGEARQGDARTLIARLRLVIEQLKGAHRQLQILCARLAEPVERTDEEAKSGKLL